jgi:uncharacterized protein involved in exopolysaccharide biosynthesis
MRARSIYTFNPSMSSKARSTQGLRFSLRDLVPPLLRRKRTFPAVFFFVVSVTLLFGHLRFQKYQSQTIANVTIAVPSSIALLPAHSSAVLILNAIVLGLLIGLSLTYLFDYCDPCFHSGVQVIRTLRVPLVVAIPKRPS